MKLDDHRPPTSLRMPKSDILHDPELLESCDDRGDGGWREPGEPGDVCPGNTLLLTQNVQNRQGILLFEETFFVIVTQHSLLKSAVPIFFHE